MSALPRLLAVAIAAALLLSLLRTRGADPPPSIDAPESSTDAPSTARVTGSAPSTTAPAAAGALLRLEVHAEVPLRESGPPIAIRVRPREGAMRAFDVTAREAAARQRLLLEIGLPVRDPELPLRCELVEGSEWCIPPGRVEFEVAQLATPTRLQLERARVTDVLLLAEDGTQPVARAQLRHESGVLLATTAIDGRARLVRPRRATRDELVIALADGFLPAALDASGRTPLLLRSRARGGRVRGIVLEPRGTPAAGVLVQPRHEPAGDPPADPAASAIHRLLAATHRRDVPALAVTSGADGRFELPVAWPGRLVLLARSRELGRASAVLAGDGIADAGRTSEIELRFARLVDFAIAVFRDGRGAAGVALELVHRDASGTNVVAAAITAAEGRAVLRGPAVAPLWLVARASGLAPGLVDLDAGPGEPPPVEVRLEPGRSVAFTLAGADALAPEERIVLVRDAASGVLLSEQALDAAGSVRIDQLPAGRKLELLLPAGGPAGLLLRELELAEEEGASELDLGSVEIPLR